MNEPEELTPEDQQRIRRLKSREECAQFAENVRDTHPWLARAARRRAIELQLESHATTSKVLRDIWGAVYAYEEVLFIKHGRRLRAGHTRRSITMRGEVPAIEAIVKRPNTTDGFERMREAGLFENTFESVVIRNPEHFSAAAVTSAKVKLQNRTGDRPDDNH